MKKIQINIDWSVVFWLGVITVFLWLIAKAVGLIHTPWYLEAIPYIGSFIALLAMAKEIGKFVYKVERALGDIGEIKIDIKNVKHDIHSLDKRVSVLETRF